MIKINFQMTGIQPSGGCRSWVAGLLVPVFLLTTVFQANPALAAEVPFEQAAHPAILKSLKTLVLPEAFGRLEDVFEASENSPKIILIQDAHAVPDAQRSIRHLLLYLQKNYGISRVAVEGAAQKLDPALFRSFPDKALLATVLRASMDRGELSGSVAAALMGMQNSSENEVHQREPEYFGIEDWALYEQALKLYLKGVAAQEASLRFLSGPIKKIEDLKKQKYSPALLAVDRAEKEFQENRKDLSDFLQTLSQVKAPPAGSELALFVEESRESKSVSAELEAEAREIANRLSSKQPSFQAENRRLLNRESQAFLTGEVDAEQFALTLKEICSREKIECSMSELLSRGAQKHKRLRDIEGTRFFMSLEQYAQSVKAALFETDENQKLDQAAYELALFQRLVKLELSKSDWEKIRNLKEVLTPEAGRARDYQYPYAFYENAEKRDQIFYEKLKKGARAGETIVMVAGGFHSQGLIERLKASGMSYALVMPSIDRLPDATNYRQHMRGDVSWKSYFTADKGRVNLYEAFVRYIRDQLLGSNELLAPMLMKSWRDELIRDLSRSGRIEEAGHYTVFLDEWAAGKYPGADAGLQRLERFFDGLRRLERGGLFQAPQILKLLKMDGPAVSGMSVPSGADSASVLARDSRLQLAAMTEVRPLSVSEAFAGMLKGQWKVTSRQASPQEEGEARVQMSFPDRPQKRSEVRGISSGVELPVLPLSAEVHAYGLGFVAENSEKLRRLSSEAKRFFRQALDPENFGLSKVYRFGVRSHDSRDFIWAVRSKDSSQRLLGLQQIERLPYFYNYSGELGKIPQNEQIATGVIVLDPSLRGQGFGVELKKAAFQLLMDQGASFYYASISGGIERNKASYQMTLRAAEALQMPVYQMPSPGEFLVQLRKDFLDPETPKFLETLQRVSTAKSEVRGLNPGSPGAMWEQLKGVLARANQAFVEEALGGDWVSCGPASIAFAKDIEKLIPGSSASVVKVSKFKQESLNNPELFTALKDLAMLIQSFALEKRVSADRLLGIVFGKTDSRQGTVLQVIASNAAPADVITQIGDFYINQSQIQPQVIEELILRIRAKFTDGKDALRLIKVSNQLEFYPGGYPTPPKPFKMLPLLGVSGGFFTALPKTSAASYGASRHIVNFIEIDGRKHLVDLTVSQYDGTAYPVDQVMIIEDVDEAKLIEQGYLFEYEMNLAQAERDSGRRDLSYTPYIQSVLESTRSEMRAGADVLEGDEIRARILELSNERKRMTGSGAEETRKAFEMQLEILRLSSVVREPFHGIGDVHGAASALKTLFETIPKDETVLQVGDMIDRGEDSPGALEILRTAQKERAEKGDAPVFRLLGNHEMMLLEGYIGNDFALLNWYRELPPKNRESVFGTNAFNLSGRSDEDGNRLRALLREHPQYKNMIDGMIEDIARGDLLGAFVSQGQIVTHAGIDPAAILPELEYEVLEYLQQEPENLTAEERAERVSDIQIAERINRIVRQAFQDAKMLVDAGISPAPAFWHLIFLRKGIFWNRNMEHQQKLGRRQSFGHTPKPDLTTFNHGSYVNFDTSIYHSSDPITMYVDRQRNVLRQTVLMESLLQEMAAHAPDGDPPPETASPELQRGWPEFEHPEALTRKVRVEDVPESLKGLEAELGRKLSALPANSDDTPVFSPDEVSMLAARLVNRYPPGKYVFAEMLGRWFVADREEWKREYNMEVLQPFDWQELTKVRGYGTLLFNDDLERGSLVEQIYDEWPDSSAADIGPSAQQGIPSVPSLAVGVRQLNVGGLTLNAQILEDGSLDLRSGTMTPILIRLAELESGVTLGRTSFEGVSDEVLATVSRSHVKLISRSLDAQDRDYLRVQVLVQDIGSRNGAKVNGRDLEKNGQAELLVETVLPRANLRSEVRSTLPRSLEEALGAKRALIQSEQPDAIDEMLFYKFGSRYTRVTLRHQEDLDYLVSQTRIENGGVETSEGPLMKIIREGGVLLIDYAGSDPKLVDSLNKLLDVRNASYRGVTVHADLRVLGVVSDPIHTFDTPFKRRYANKKLRLEDLAYEDPFHDGERFKAPEGLSAVFADLDESPEVERVLLGETHFDEQGRLTIDEAPPLVRAVQSGQPLIIRGASLYRNSELARFLRQLLLRREYRYNGRTEKLPEDFKVYLDEGNYGQEMPQEKTFVPDFDFHDTVYVLNNSTSDQLFTKTYANESGLLAQEPGLLERGGKPLNFLVTENLPDWVWHKILKSSRKIQIRTASGVSIPAVYEKWAANELREFSARTMSEPAAWQRADSAVLQGDDTALLRQKIHEEFAGQEIVEFFAGPQTLANDLLESLEFSGERTRAGQPAKFTAKAFLEALKRGAVVILDGVDDNEDLQRSLESLLIENAYFLENGEPEFLRDFNSRLYVVSRSSLTVQAAVKELVYEDSPQEELKRILQKEFPERFDEEGKDSFEKIQRLVSIFQSLPQLRKTEESTDGLTLDLDRLRQLYRFKDLRKAFERHVISKYQDLPETAAFMRVMVRIIFDDGKDSSLSVDEKLALQAANRTVGNQSKEQNFWQFAESLSTALLRQTLTVEAGFLGQNSQAVFRSIGLAFAKKARDEGDAVLEAFYRQNFGLEDSENIQEAPFVVSGPASSEREIREQELREIAEDLSIAKAGFFQGAPGTGKSYSVSEIAAKLGFNPKTQIVRVTTGRDASYGDVIAQQSLDTNGKTHTVDGAVARWARLENGGILQADEANLPKGAHFWDFLKGLFAPKPFVDIDGERVFLTDRHFVVFTGNENSLEGRHDQDFIKKYAMTVPFHPFGADFMREAALDRFQQLSAQTRRDKQNLPDLARLVMDLHTLFNKVHGERDFSIRDVLELTERAFYQTGETWSEEQIVTLAWDQYSGFFDKAERAALEALLFAQFGLKIKEIYGRKADEMTESLNSAPSFSEAGIVLTRSVKNILTSAQIFLQVTQSHAEMAKGQSADTRELYKSNGKKGMLIEGHAGRGKDVVLMTLFDALGIPYEHISASLDTQELEDAIQRAMTQGTVLLVSELNLLDSAYLEGKLNDVLTGDAAEGFAFFATINSADYSGREKLSTALQNRLLYHRLEDYDPQEYRELAQNLKGPLSDGEVEKLLSFHLWAAESIPELGRRPSAAEFLQTLGLMRDQNAGFEDAVEAVYGLGYTEGILGAVRLPTKDEMKKVQAKATQREETVYRKILQNIAEMIIPREKGPVTIDTEDESAPNADGYYMESQNLIHLEPRVFKNGNWLSVLFHEASHGLFTRLKVFRGIISKIIINDFEDLRHTTAFDRLFPHAGIGKANDELRRFAKAAAEPKTGIPFLSSQMKIRDNPLTVRLLFRTALMAYGKKLVTREQLEALADQWPELDEKKIIQRVLAVLESVDVIADALPGNLTENEIKIQQFRALHAMREIQDQYDSISQIKADIVGNTVPAANTAVRTAAVPQSPIQFGNAWESLFAPEAEEESAREPEVTLPKARFQIGPFLKPYAGKFLRIGIPLLMMGGIAALAYWFFGAAGIEGQYAAPAELPQIQPQIPDVVPEQVSQGDWTSWALYAAAGIFLMAVVYWLLEPFFQRAGQVILRGSGGLGLHRGEHGGGSAGRKSAEAVMRGEVPFSQLTNLFVRNPEMRRVSESIRKDLAPVLREFSISRIQADRVYGPAGTLDIHQMIAHAPPSRMFRKSGGVPELVLMPLKIGVQSDPDTKNEFEHLQHAALAEFLHLYEELGGKVTVAYGTPAFDGIQKTGASAFIHERQLSEKVEALYVYGLIQKRLREDLAESKRERRRFDEETRLNRELGLENVLRSRVLSQRLMSWPDLRQFSTLDVTLDSSDQPWSWEQIRPIQDRVTRITFSDPVKVDLSPLAETWPKLSYLDLSRTKITDISPLFGRPIQTIILPASVSEEQVKQLFKSNPMKNFSVLRGRRAMHSAYGSYELQVRLGEFRRLVTPDTKGAVRSDWYYNQAFIKLDPSRETFTLDLQSHNAVTQFFELFKGDRAARFFKEFRGIAQLRGAGFSQDFLEQAAKKGIQFDRDILPMLAQQPQLEALDLYMPHDKDVSVLSELKPLKSLKISHVPRFTMNRKPPNLAKVRPFKLEPLISRHGDTLESLHVESYRLPEDLDHLEQFGNLRELGLGVDYAGSKFFTKDSFDLKWLESLGRLESLSLQFVPTVNPQVLPTLQSLQSLYLSYVSMPLPDLAPLEALRELRISFNSEVTNLDFLGGLRRLERLTLDSEKVSTLEPVSRLTRLQNLVLRTRSVSDLSPLNGLSDLKTVHLTVQSPKGIQALQGKNIRDLELRFTELPDGKDSVQGVLAPIIFGHPDLTRARLHLTGPNGWSAELTPDNDKLLKEKISSFRLSSPEETLARVSDRISREYDIIDLDISRNWHTEINSKIYLELDTMLNELRTMTRSEVRSMTESEKQAYDQSFNLAESPGFRQIVEEMRGAPGDVIREKLREQESRLRPQWPSRETQRAFLNELGRWAGLQGPAILSFAGGFDVSKPRAAVDGAADILSFGLQPFGSSQEVMDVAKAVLVPRDLHLWRVLTASAFDMPQHLMVYLSHRKVVKSDGGLGGLAAARLAIAESEASGEIRSIRYFKLNGDESIEFLPETRITETGSAMIEYRVSENAPWQRFWYVQLDLADSQAAQTFTRFVQRFDVGGVFVSAPMQIFREPATSNNALKVLHALNPKTPILSDQAASPDGRPEPYQPPHAFWMSRQAAQRNVTEHGLGFGYSNPSTLTDQTSGIAGYTVYAGRIANVRLARSEVRHETTVTERAVHNQMLYPRDKIHSKDLVLDAYDRAHYRFFPNRDNPKVGFWKREGMPSGVELVLGTWEDIKRKMDPDHQYNYPGMDNQTMQRHVVTRYKTAGGQTVSFYAYDDHVYSLPYAFEARERGELSDQGNYHLFLDDHADNYRVPEPPDLTTARGALDAIASNQQTINEPRMNNFNSLWPREFLAEHIHLYDQRVASSFNTSRRDGTVHRAAPLQNGTPVLAMDWTLYSQYAGRPRTTDRKIFIDIDTDMTGGGDSVAGVLPDAKSVLQTYTDLLSQIAFEDGVTPALFHASTTKGQGAPYGDVEIARFLNRAAPLLFLGQGAGRSAADIAEDLQVIQNQHTPYVRAHLRSEVRARSGNFQEFMQRRDRERSRVSRRIFFSAAGVSAAGFLIFMSMRQDYRKKDRAKRSIERRERQGVVPSNAPWSLFPLEDKGISDLEKIKRSLQITSDWLIQEGYGNAAALDEYAGYLEEARQGKDLGRSLLAKSYDSQEEGYTIEVQTQPLLELLREVQGMNSKDLFTVLLGGLVMRESIGMTLTLHAERTLKEISVETGRIERERRQLMPAGQMAPNLPVLRQFLQGKTKEIDHLLTSLLAFEYLEARWEWMFYAQAADRGDFSLERVQALRQKLRDKNEDFSVNLNTQVQSSQLLIETGGEPLKILRSQLTGLAFEHYVDLRRGALTREKDSFPSAGFLLSNYALIHEVNQFVPRQGSKAATGVAPEILEVMAAGRWPGFEGFTAYADRLLPDLRQSTDVLTREIPFVSPTLKDSSSRDIQNQMDELRNSLRESLERPKRPERRLFDSDGPAAHPDEKKSAADPLGKRSEVRRAENLLRPEIELAMRFELQEAGEGLAQFAAGTATDQTLTDISERLEDVYGLDNAVTVEPIIEILKEISSQSRKASAGGARQEKIRKGRPTLELRAAQLLRAIVGDRMRESFSAAQGGYTVAASLGRGDGKTIAMHLVDAVRELHDAGAVKHALVIAEPVQRKALAEEQSRAGLSLEVLEILSKLPSPGRLSAKFDNGQTKLPTALRPGAEQPQTGGQLIPIELIDEDSGLSAEDLEIMEPVAIFLQIAAGAVIARYPGAKAKDIQSKLIQLVQVKGAEIDEKVLQAVFKVRGHGFGLSPRGLAGVMRVLQTQFEAISAIRSAA